MLLLLSCSIWRDRSEAASLPVGHVHVLAIFAPSCRSLFSRALAALIFHVEACRKRSDQVRGNSADVRSVTAGLTCDRSSGDRRVSVRAFATGLLYFRHTGFTFTCVHLFITRAQWRVFFRGRTGFVAICGSVILTMVGILLVVLLFLGQCCTRLITQGAVTAAIRRESQSTVGRRSHHVGACLISFCLLFHSAEYF